MALITSQPKNPILNHFTTFHRAIPRLNKSVIGLGSFSNNAKPIKVSNFNSNSTKFSIKNNPCSLKVIAANAAFSEIFEPQKQHGPNNLKKPRKILFSDVEVTREKEVFFGRKWSTLDIGTGVIVLSMHVLSLFAPFNFNWSAFWVGVSLYVVTGLFGITLSFHRNLSHKSFKVPKWLEYFFAYCGVLALQGNPIDWVSTHRYHHQFCESARDPHTPTQGFWYSHMTWLFDTNSITEKYGEPNNVVDLEKQFFYRFMKSSYIFHPLALGALLYAIGGFPFIVWGVGVRIVWVYHITWLVNSVCHVWGSQAWNTGDLSRNNWWVSLFAFGEGWHNNHHAFEYSARHGLEWWELDMTWYVVRFLQAIGLATEVKLPNESHKQRMAFNNNGGIAT
ncbi:PREDICTED: palmitoyl-monogalactosyldiacylglycerol delta-7 desaturase, chloroplastic-like [Lupinus angustifolius]|uniref:palmitoyl-monogalactosyldiacylglycerol delta-7 desaturase, chloroplastic-like n=1 Tax=Lupinus angustifolius TaxID=3871 RepID=UPI00092ED53F|nr:PREDICTED: palmitoyl-monogalactosyldiacylglycerol delta-7 desaturase, chloroplastic-like [Lupinus angustifolius]XP_019456130.1 PREDICTED: palmitoyl-monogalactosyldiacylglycerol delta-7 desaturase, chloroplastic-like [Lupinus angustifolius]